MIYSYTRNIGVIFLNKLKNKLLRIRLLSLDIKEGNQKTSGKLRKIKLKKLIKISLSKNKGKKVCYSPIVKLMAINDINFYNNLIYSYYLIFIQV